MLFHVWIALTLGAMSVRSRRIVDLTHTLDGDATKWPLTSLNITNLTYFNSETLSATRHDNGIWLALKRVEFYEHLGTHMDAPIHFAENRQTMHEIPPEKLIGPGVVIDVRDKAKETPNYAVSVSDLLDWETKHGQIPPSSIVIMNSDWASRYPNPELTFGTQTPENSSTFNFPGWSNAACQMLLTDRQVNVVGVDTPSIDPGDTVSFPCHVLLTANQMPLLEYVANLDAIPPCGTTMVLGALKTRGGTGGHCRIFALLDDDGDTMATDGGDVATASMLLWVVSLVAAVMS